MRPSTSEMLAHHSSPQSVPPSFPSPVSPTLVPSPSAPRARVAPLQEFLKQLLVVLFRAVLPAARTHELVELLAVVRGRAALAVVLGEPRLGGGEARPARQRRRQVDLAPFRMMRSEERRVGKEGRSRW